MALNIVRMAQGTGSPAGSEGGEGRSAGPDRIARARAAAEGKPIKEAQADPQVAKAQVDIRRIKMNTQRSVYRDLPQDNAESNIPDTNETVNQPIGETKPIDPQIALKAQYNRAIQKVAQEKDAKIAELESKLKDVNPAENEDYIPVSKLTANPLSVLREKGVTYDQLTEAILSEQNQQTPAVLELKAELKALRDSLENQNKTRADQDEASKQQVLSQMERDAAKMIASDDNFEMVRESGSVKDVIRLIDQTFSKTGEVLDVEEALLLVENQLLEDSLKLARTKKVLGKLTPPQHQQTAKPQNNSNVRVMRTLTNRDGASAPSSARERAIAAFHGRKS